MNYRAASGLRPFVEVQGDRDSRNHIRAASIEDCLPGLNCRTKEEGERAKCSG